MTQGSKARPRVVLVAHRVGGATGVARATEELVRRAARRVEFTVVSRALAPELRGLVRWRHAPAPGPTAARTAGLLATGGARVALERGDLVHAHAVGPLVPNRVDLTTVHFCRAAFYEARGDLGDAGLSTRAHVALERWCNRRARLLAAVSESGVAELERFFPGVPTVATPLGVDVERFRPDAVARAALRAELGAGAEDVVAIFVANAWDRKGLHETIDALALADEPRLRLWVVGDGGSARYGDYARERAVEHAVRFLGVRRDVERLLAAADVFVLPTLYETFCLAAWEAAAAGLPLVVTPVNGVHELTGDGRAGIVVERTAQPIADALKRLTADAELRGRLGAEGRRRAEGYTWDRSVERVLEVYDRLLAGRA